MIKSASTLLLIAGLAAAGHAQTIALFTVDQPPQFMVDAGEAQVFSGSPLILGGQPTATGGGGLFNYAWEPGGVLDDPAAANPVVLWLTATTMFTAIVTDLTSGCVKTAEVEVEYASSVPDVDGKRSIRVYPNPTVDDALVEAQEAIHAITLFTLAGREILYVAHPVSKAVQLDLSDSA